MPAAGTFRIMRHCANRWRRFLKSTELLRRMQRSSAGMLPGRISLESGSRGKTGSSADLSRLTGTNTGGQPASGGMPPWCITPQRQNTRCLLLSGMLKATGRGLPSKRQGRRRFPWRYFTIRRKSQTVPRNNKKRLRLITNLFKCPVSSVLCSGG